MNRRSFISLSAGFCLSLFTLGGCAAFSDQEAKNAGALDSQTSTKPLVLTTFTVLQDIAQNIAQDHLRVESITKPGAEIHDYEPTPDDIKRGLGADLVLNNGLGLERWFEKFMADSQALRVDLSEGVEAIPIAEGEYEGNANPHAWMSPKNVQIYVDNIVDAFSKLDSQHTADFEAAATAYKDKLEAINQRIIDELAQIPEDARTLVTSEGAFSYLCRDAHLGEAYLWPVNAENEGTPQQIAKVVALVKEKHIPTVFCESTVSPKAMQQVADECHVNFATDTEHVLYVDSLSDQTGPVPTFLDLLEHDAKLIIDGLKQGQVTDNA